MLSYSLQAPVLSHWNTPTANPIQVRFDNVSACCYCQYFLSVDNKVFPWLEMPPWSFQGK